MATSILAWITNPLSDREAWQATVYRVAESDTMEATLHVLTQDFFSLWQLCPVRGEHEGGAAAWLAGTLVVPSVQGHRLLLPQELWP